MIRPGGIFVRVAKWDHIRGGDGLLCELPFAEAAGVAARWPLWECPTICRRCRDVYELLAPGVEVRAVTQSRMATEAPAFRSVGYLPGW